MLSIKRMLLVAILACSMPLHARPHATNIAALQQEYKQLRHEYKLKKQELKQALPVKTQTEALNQHIERENKRFAQKKEQEAAQLKILHKLKKIKTQEKKDFLCLAQEAQAEKRRIKEEQDNQAARRFIAELEQSEKEEQRIAEEHNLQAARQIAAELERADAQQAERQRAERQRIEQVQQQAAQARQREIEAREHSLVLRVARQAEAEERRIAGEPSMQELQDRLLRLRQEGQVTQALAEQALQARQRRHAAEARRVEQEAQRIREAQARRVQETRPLGYFKRFKNAVTRLFELNTTPIVPIVQRPAAQTPAITRPTQSSQPIELPVVSRPAAAQQTTTANTIPVSDCCICMESLDRQNVTVLHCNRHCRVKHAFHTACLNQHRAQTGLYVNGSNTCPTCRIHIDPLLENKPWNEVVRKLLQLNVTLPDAE